MSIGIDPVAFCLALFVAVLTIIEFRRNHKVLLRVVEVSAIGSQGREHNGALTYEFRILIRNVGIALHDVEASLSFRPPGGAGWMSAPLKRFNLSRKSVQGGEFAKGMIGAFGLNTAEMDDDSIQFLRLLKDPVLQDASIIIFSQGYRAKEFKIGVGWDRITKRWNEFGWRINPMFDSWVRPKGSKQKFIKRGNVIRPMPSIHWPMTNFLSYLKSVTPKPKVKAEPLFSFPKT